MVAQFSHKKFNFKINRINSFENNLRIEWAKHLANKKQVKL